MCVILIGKIGKDLHNQAKTENPHGFSLYTQEQGLVKNPTKNQVNNAVNQFGIWHYRIASSGGVSLQNIHPFPVAQGKAYLYHNGIIGSGTDTMSDTACLAKTLEQSSMETVISVLESLSDSNRFVLASAKNPRNFRLFGKWACEAGVLMSHKMYRTYGSLAQRAGWSSRSTYLTEIDDNEVMDESEWNKMHSWLESHK